MQKTRRLDSWRALETILESGKAKSIGVSNYGIHHLQELFRNCRIRPSVNQVELHPFLTRIELVEFCRTEGIVLEAYSPLVKGQRFNDRTLVEIAHKYNKTPAQVLIRWGMQKNFVVLPKTVKINRLAENGNVRFPLIFPLFYFLKKCFSQVHNFEISEDDMARLDSLDEDFTTGWDPTRGP